MKKLNYILLFILGTSLFASCYDEVSERLLFTEDHTVNTERSAFYAMNGILRQLQEIGDDYVILGELQGDLMDVTAHSTKDLRDINNHTVDSTNTLANPKPYYAVINNCNYLIAKIDTGVVINNSKILRREMAAAKSIRAWTYMQLFFNFGKVYYTKTPILDVNTQNRVEAIADFRQLSDSLIADLTPWLPANGVVDQYPNYGNIGAFESTKLFIPIRFLLGDLYLWRGDYAQAASMYYQLMRANQLTVLANKNSWNATQTGYTTHWPKLFTDLTLTEHLALIGYSTEFANYTTLPGLTSASSYMLAPSAAAISTWASQTYSISNSIILPGDLRAISSYSTFTERNKLNENEEFKYITKYKHIAGYVSLCRASLVYLRYAEAINRMGKPNLAYVFLKYGLNKSGMETYAQNDIKSKEAFIDFGQGHLDTDPIVLLFKNNVAIRSRGCNEVGLNNSFKFPAGEDSIQWVEDQLVTEYALETAFEGNRFQDLMRVSTHRNDPAYLAQKVAAKFPEAQRGVILARLSEKKNWYLPEKK